MKATMGIVYTKALFKIPPSPDTIIYPRQFSFSNSLKRTTDSLHEHRFQGLATWKQRLIRVSKGIVFS